MQADSRSTLSLAAKLRLGAGIGVFAFLAVVAVWKATLASDPAVDGLDLSFK